MARRLAIERQYYKPLTPFDTHGAEVSLIEREHFPDRVSFRKHYDRSVGESDLEIGISLDHFFGATNIGGREWFQLIGAASNLVE